MNRIYIEVAFDNIYNFALGRLKCHGEAPFSIEVPTPVQIVGIEAGTRLEGSSLTLASVNDKGSNILQFSCIGLVRQKKFRHLVAETDLDSYGMQYYPFISSDIDIRLVARQIEFVSLSIILPEAYRVIWFRRKVSRNGCLAEIAHSQGQKESVYVFSWPTDSNAAEQTELVASIPVRLGGKEYLRVISFPYWYYSLSLVGLAVLALQDKPNVTFGGVAAAWVLMLRHFTKANAPQLNTVLRDLYFWSGLFMLVWALAWEIAGYGGLVLVAPVVWAARAFSRLSDQFKKDGILPRYAEEFLFRIRYRNEQRNRANKALQRTGDRR